LEEYSELIGETSELVRGEGPILADLGESGSELSTGLILTRRHFYAQWLAWQEEEALNRDDLDSRDRDIL
jgi:hypothetical protein